MADNTIVAEECSCPRCGISYHGKTKKGKCVCLQCGWVHHLRDESKEYEKRKAVYKRRK